jgi:hypothetical protein
VPATPPATRRWRRACGGSGRGRRPVCAALLGPRPGRELGLGGTGVFGQCRRRVGLVDAPGAPRIRDNVQAGHRCLSAAAAARVATARRLVGVPFWKLGQMPVPVHMPAASKRWHWARRKRRARRCRPRWPARARSSSRPAVRAEGQRADNGGPRLGAERQDQAVVPEYRAVARDHLAPIGLDASSASEMSANPRSWAIADSSISLCGPAEGLADGKRAKGEMALGRKHHHFDPFRDRPCSQAQPRGLRRRRRRSAPGNGRVLGDTVWRIAPSLNTCVRPLAWVRSQP